MKRMYVTLGIIFVIFLWAAIGLGQMIDVQKVDSQGEVSSDMDRMKKALQLREEMHKRMRDKLFHGFGSDDDLFQGMDKLIEEAMSDSFSGMHSFMGSVGSSSHFKIETKDSAGMKTFIITPQSPEQQLDINVEKNMMTIKGKAEKKTAHGSSVSSFSNSFGLPPECDGSKVKMDQRDGKIFVEFPCIGAQEIQKPKDERQPISPRGNEVTI